MAVRAQRSASAAAAPPCPPCALPLTRRRPPPRCWQVLGAGMAWVMLGERLGAKGFAGAAIILASSLVTQVLGGKDGGEAAPEPVPVLAKDKAE